MRCELAVPFVDSRADELAHSLTTDPREPLHALVLPARNLQIELRILGSSHQVIIDGLDTPFIETVACGVSNAELPDCIRTERGNNGAFGYHFDANVVTHATHDFATRVRALVESLDADPAALVGVFPGSDLAVTALKHDINDVQWQTWHCYPNTGEVVTTQTRILL